MSGDALKEQKTILVTGDFVLDNHIYEGRRSHYGDNTSAGVHLKSELGGAALVHDLLAELLKPEKENITPLWQSVCGVANPVMNSDRCKIDPSDQAFAFWRPFPKDMDPDKQYWRVSEAMGFGPANLKPKCSNLSHAELADIPRIVVYSEGGMGFRQCEENWRKDLLAHAEWIVLKNTSPIADGELWQHLTANYSEKLILIVSAKELRKSPVRMNAGLSWEETVEGVLRELGSRGKLSALSSCRHLIIAFDSEGALWLDLTNGFTAASACLIYDSGAIEGELDTVTKGTAFGFLSCLAASISWYLSMDTEKPDFATALERGLATMRDLREKGHGLAKDIPSGFPAKRLATVVKSTTVRYSRAFFTVADIDTAKAGTTPWSLLSQAHRNSGPAFELARLVLLRGPIALENLPHLSIGNLLTADRSEIESLRTMDQVIRRYKDNDSGKKPLSIGVFGPPGSGKSFAVKELATNLVKKGGWMEFNLSQFDKSEDLIGAFHQIRDRVLQGLLPVVFFDEFDSQEYKWLQYLLAPMQDGKFQDGQLTHTLGKCIFIFAGGTSPTYETFGPPDLTSDNDTETDLQRDFRLAKGPDFKSRIDVYFDVLGPNQRRKPLKPGEAADGEIEIMSGRKFIIDPTDVVYPVRRALMIRAQLKCSKEDKLKMDEGLIHALLHVKKYTHGNRSLEKILQPFASARPGGLHSSLLMPAGQLAMYTCKDEFISMCTNPLEPFSPDAPLTKAQTEIIAPAISETYRELGRIRGWKANPETDRDFNDLELFYQNSNRAAAIRMLNLLGLLGLTLVEGVASESEENEIRNYLEYYLLVLADAEHERWMEWHIEQGWSYAKKTDKGKNLHQCLLPFIKLTDDDKDKDVNSIRHYPDFARKAGMKIEFAG